MSDLISTSLAVSLTVLSSCSASSSSVIGNVLFDEFSAIFCFASSITFVTVAFATVNTLTVSSLFSSPSSLDLSSFAPPSSSFQSRLLVVSCSFSLAIFFFPSGSILVSSSLDALIDLSSATFCCASFITFVTVDLATSITADLLTFSLFSSSFGAFLAAVVSSSDFSETIGCFVSSFNNDDLSPCAPSSVSFQETVVSLVDDCFPVSSGILSPSSPWPNVGTGSC